MLFHWGFLFRSLPNLSAGKLQKKEQTFTESQGFFQDFLLGPFLQRRLSLAEQLGWLHPPPPTGGLTSKKSLCFHFLS
jgi:hypothetical protein